MYQVMVLKMFSFALLVSTIHAHSQSNRILVPASDKASLLIRSNEVKVHFEDTVQLLYAQGSNVDDDRNYVATVTITPKKPLLILEEVEHLFSSITCADDSISLSMPTSYDAVLASDIIESVVGGHVITSHPSCNLDSERRVYYVTEMKMASSSSFVLLAAETSFRSAFHPLDVHLGYTSAAHELRPGTLAGRDTHEITLDLDSLSLIDHPLWDGISCRNCSLYGELDFEEADFSWDCGFLDSIENIDSPSKCLSGIASATFKGVGMEVDLEVSVSNSWTQQIPLFSKSINHTIPLIGTATLSLGPTLQLSYVMNGSLEMSYGFNMKLGEDAKAWIDLSHTNASGAQGFDQATITAIPFQSKAEIQSLKLSAALQSGVTLAFNFDDVPLVSGQAQAGVYVDTPAIFATVTPVNNVGVDCKPLSGSSGSKTKISDILTSVIRVDVTKQWIFGYNLAATADSLSLGNLSHTYSSKPEYLTEMCLNFDSKTNSYQSATEAVKAKEAEEAKNAVNVGSFNTASILVYVLAVVTTLFVML